MDNPDSTLNILWKGKYLILVGLLFGVGAAVLATKLSAKVYESTGVVQVTADVPSAGSTVLTLQQASQDQASTYATLISSSSFLARIRPLVEHGRYSTSYLAANVSAKAVTQNTQNTNLIEIVGQGPTPTAAQTLTEEVASAFVRTVSSDGLSRGQQQQSLLQRRIDTLTKQLSQLERQTPVSATVREREAAIRETRSALTAQMATTIAQNAGQEGSVSIVAPAVARDAPVKPRPALNVVLGVVLGLLIGIGTAWLRAVFDRELHSSSEVEHLVSLPVLASIPIRRGLDVDDLVTREAYDVLRTNLTFVSLESPLGALTITSSESGEGKSTTAEGLAYAARRRDLKVLLLDGDIRTGRLSARLGATNHAGLVNVIAAGADLNAALVEIGPGISLLPAGPAPPNPPSVLSNPKMLKMMIELRRRFDLIVIDSPPVGHLADAVILAALSDASVLVARAGVTVRSNLVAAANALRRTPAPIVGVVVLERRPLDPVYYPAGGTQIRRAERPSPPSSLRQERARRTRVEQRQSS